MRRAPLSYPLAAVVAAAALLPVAVLLYLGVGAGPALSPRALGILGETALLTGLSVAGAVLIGVPLAVASACVELPLRRFWLVALTAPLAMPSYIGAFALFAAFGPGGEIEHLLGLTTPPVRGLWGAALVMALYTYPFVLLTTRASLRGLDAGLVDAARTLGLSLPMALLRVVLPRVRNGIAAGALLSALYTLSDFATPAIMQVDTFTRVIFI
ncbi:iron ABC transporter permease, partial [Arhodomonas sp. KWT]